jgi:hypothetical protein
MRPTDFSWSIMAYALGGLLLLLVIFVFATVETRLELRRVNEQVTQV